LKLIRDNCDGRTAAALNTIVKQRFNIEFTELAELLQAHGFVGGTVFGPEAINSAFTLRGQWADPFKGVISNSFLFSLSLSLSLFLSFNISLFHSVSFSLSLSLSLSLSVSLYFHFISRLIIYLFLSCFILT
jgi:hypothetical protein